MKRGMYVLGMLMAFAAIAVGWRFYSNHVESIAWKRHAAPGALSAPHAALENSCEACHTANKGPVDTKCIGCHANETALLQRQPTAFHANIPECAGCHIEHRGRQANLRQMDHPALARIGLQMLDKGPRGNSVSADELIRWVNAHPGGPGPTPSHPNLTALEMTLNCGTCHATKDRHAGLFGADCASCHATTQWSLANFQHPSPRSFDCAQCHQAPPSHYMMHFDMVSKKIARQEDERVAQCCGVAQVNQCQRCHQTTSWNDIKGVGWYKHH